MPIQPNQLHEATILALTGDTQTQRDGSKLATRVKWPRLGMDNGLIWGECQGSGKDPYRVVVDQLAQEARAIQETAYKCTCPSRKFPCKHTIGLLLLLVKQPTLFSEKTPPAWAQEWQAQRRQHQAKTAPAKPVTVETTLSEAAAQSKRAQAREEKVAAGLEELQLWLRDLVRRGLSDEQIKSYGFWDRMAARMVDAQASSVARRLRQMASIPAAGKPDWAARLLDEVSRLYLLADSYSRLVQLPPATQADIRTAVGWSYKKEELATQPSVRDHWLALGQYVESEDNLRTRRVWLYGATSGQMALLLDFAHGKTSFEANYVTSHLYDAELVYYPSSYPQRALLTVLHHSAAADSERGMAAAAHATFQDALAGYAAALAQQPWLEALPMVVRAVRVQKSTDGYWLLDSQQNVLPATLPQQESFARWWPLAMTGGHPTYVFGEWDGYRFHLLAMIPA